MFCIFCVLYSLASLDEHIINILTEIEERQSIFINSESFLYGRFEPETVKRKHTLKFIFCFCSQNNSCTKYN